MNNKNTTPILLFLILLGIATYFYFSYSSQSKKYTFDQQIKCEELGKKEAKESAEINEIINSASNTSKEFTYVYSKKRNSCLRVTEITDMQTFKTKYLLHDMFSRELIASFNDECMELIQKQKSLDSFKCVGSIEEFEKQQK